MAGPIPGFSHRPGKLTQTRGEVPQARPVYDRPAREGHIFSRLSGAFRVDCGLCAPGRYQRSMVRLSSQALAEPAVP